MTKGFKKKIGNEKKFIPTQRNTKSSLSKHSIRDKKNTDVKFKKPVNFEEDAETLKQKRKIPEQKVTDVFKFDDLDESAKEKAREWGREVVGQDDFFADQDGLIFDKKSGLADYDVFKNYSKKFYDLDRGQFIQFPDLEVKDEKKFAKMLELPKSVADRISYKFVDPNDSTNTQVIFFDDPTGEDIDFHRDDQYQDYKKYTNEDDDLLTKAEFDKLEKGSDKFDDLIHDAWVALRNSYEGQFEDEYIDDFLQANEYEFDREGNRV